MLELDHIAVLGGTLEAAADHCAQALGVPMGPGGVHTRFATHNRLLGLGQGHYLEAIAVDPKAAPPPDARWFGLDRFNGQPRLDKWICRVADIEAAVARFPEAGRVVHLSRGDLRWSMAVPLDGMLPFDGLFPALIQWHVPKPPGASLPGDGRRLTRLVVQHPRAIDLLSRLGDAVPGAPVQIEPGPVPKLTAHIATADGDKVLE
ncbi:VOC family protein [Mesobacterium sp. TK19101]|uniref:VOC family protein n=1 Tax=Mesobacterium hydrothermale TaxID=3111907 RepID=A0ABU6HN42_9RHOB|nr:VOC family protein [Mesobacterium sp. TK19101]MEC3863260.1 VOC family protein [Mesobacterium sp. TK19101]